MSLTHHPYRAAGDALPHAGKLLDCEACLAAWLTDALPPQPPPGSAPHHVQVRVTRNPDGPGGVWRASCSCGWSVEGPYARSSADRIAARLAEERALRHIHRPQEEEL